MRIGFRVVLILLSTALLAVGVQAQRVSGSGFQIFVRGNEQFGRRLLHRLQQDSPERNVVVSPISLSIILSAIQDSSDYEVASEIGKTFGWGSGGLAVPARMLLAAFERVERDPKVRYAYPAEEAWIVNRLFYRAVPNATAGVSGRPERPPFAELFRRNGEKYFGITFETTGAARPTSDDLGRSGQSTIQRLSEDNDVLIDSSVHLATSWSGNTFSMSKPFTGSFHTAAGIEQQVQMLKSELSVYRHAKTPVFEAVVLPCHRGYMVAILPAPGVQIADLGRAIAESPDTLDAELKPEIGQVTMPPFHTKVEWDLTPYLKQMGIQQAFKDLGRLFDIPRSRLTHVAQTVDIQIDQSGIRADAGTVVGAIYGGVMGGQLQPFSMTLDRPFIFLVRERISDALLFVGTVMDPTPQ